MEAEYLIVGLNTAVEILLSLAIISVCSADVFYNIKFLRKVIWEKYYIYKLIRCLVSILVVILYLYYIGMIIVGASIYIINAQTIILFLYGAASLISSRGRYITLLIGGEKWTLLK